jgi:hypothetical protein
MEVERKNVKDFLGLDMNLNTRPLPKFEGGGFGSAK